MKKIPLLFCLIPALALLSLQAAAQNAPNFAPGQYILSDNRPMEGDNLLTAPNVCDWNDDGRKDILVGLFYRGNIDLFLNQGTDADPVFWPGTRLQADGVDISVGYG